MGMFVKLATITVFASVIAQSTLCSAAESIRYVYDVKGRLIQVVRVGSVNNNVQTDYHHDNADNRMKVKTTGVR